MTQLVISEAGIDPDSLVPENVIPDPYIVVLYDINVKMPYSHSFQLCFYSLEVFMFLRAGTMSCSCLWKHTIS